MNWTAVVQVVVFLILVALGVVGYLLVVANARANHTEARVRALLRQAETGQDPTGREL